MKNTPPVICFFGTYDRNYSRNQTLFKGLTANGIQYNEVHVQLEQTKLNSQSHMKISQLLYRILRKLKFLPVVVKNIPKIKKSDVLYVAYPGHLDLPMAYIVGRIFKKKIIFDPTFSLVQVLVSDFELFKKNDLKIRLILFVEKWLFSLPDVVIADTPYQQNYYHQELGIKNERIKILPFGADDTIYKKGKQKKDNHFNVVYYGLYNPMHGVEFILESAKQLINEKDLRILMVGNGQTYPMAKKMAEEHKLTNVIFYPDSTEKNSYELLQTADVFLGFLKKSPTIFRSIPNKVLQGMAMEKAVLTADTPAIRSVLTPNKNIYTVEPSDAAKLSKALLTLKKDKNLREKIAKNGYTFFKANFTPNAISNQLLTIVNLTKGSDI